MSGTTLRAGNAAVRAGNAAVKADEVPALEEVIIRGGDMHRSTSYPNACSITTSEGKVLGSRRT